MCFLHWLFVVLSWNQSRAREWGPMMLSLMLVCTLLKTERGNRDITYMRLDVTQFDVCGAASMLQWKNVA